ncbi:excinuclease ABC subunit UvrC [Helicobacter sp. 23-1045]
MNLKEQIKSLPHTSGIYQYFDDKNRILYIGKAKDLHKRVRSYFNLRGESPAPAANVSHRIATMIRQISHLQIILTQSESDALILENSLIKQLKPKYNILLRDDKTYPYILIDKNAPFPRPEIVRKITNDKNHLYFGPYSSGSREILNAIYEILPLVQKKSCLSGKKACLFHQIGRCSAPCEGKISREKYSDIVKNAINLLQNPSKILKILEQKMQNFAKNLRFEDANLIKIQCEKIRQVAKISSIDLAKLYNCDIFVIESNATKSVLVKIFMRDGRVVFSDNIFINHNENELDLDFLYTQSLLNHYKNNAPFALDSILLPYDLSDGAILSEFFRQKFGKNIRILNPKSGEKKKLIDLAKNNAKNLLENSENSAESRILEAIKNLFSLQNVPNRIEVFDTSHFQGQSAVGAKITYENGEFVKSAYKRYTLSGSDEYAQMTELLTRRAGSFEVDFAPDLWLLDGGCAQIKIAQEIMQSCGANVDILGIAKEKINHKAYRAKGGARDILRSLDLELRLEKSDERLMFLQKLRDEAHRFAISFHRKKGRKNLQKSAISGKYTEAQLKKLLNYFGTFQSLQNADENLIKSVLKSRKVQ